jgi:hypothetical protein
MCGMAVPSPKRWQRIIGLKVCFFLWRGAASLTQNSSFV